LVEYIPFVEVREALVMRFVRQSVDRSEARAISDAPITVFRAAPGCACKDLGRVVGPSSIGLLPIS
jgi:hypothetical protein